MIQLPPSKSIGARFLVASYFSGTLPADPIYDENEDLMLLQQALLEIYSDEEPIDFGDSQIDAGSSGTALRFVTAVCASSPGADYIITGTERLMQRPMAPMIEILRKMGAGVQTLGENETGPYRVTGNKLEGGEFSIRGDISSQFISALMLVAPSWNKGMKLWFDTPLVSRPYVEMTARFMNLFGLEVKLNDAMVEVKPGKYHEPRGFQVEADWSSASFFYEACSLGCKDVEIEGLIPPGDSLQGDSVTATIFSKLGVTTSYDDKGVSLNSGGEKPERLEQDFKDWPDLVLPVAVACLYGDVNFKFTGIANLRVKESDRIDSLISESLKLGFVVKADQNSIIWEGEKTEATTDPVIDPHGDHRVAMSFAMVALKTGMIKISDPDVVRKSYIDFWNQLPELGLTCHQENNLMTISR